MTPAAALAVLSAAFCHAFWNAIIKAQPNRFAGYAVLLSVGSCLSVFGILYYGAPPRESWGYLAASVALHFAYNYLLILCYRLADISLAYPVLRGAASPIAALAGFFWLAETPAPPVIAGICIVSAGILSMAGGRGNGKAIAAALLTASVIAAYSVIDAAGARIVGNAVQYVCWITVFDGPLFMLLMLANRSGRQPDKLQWRYLLMAGIGGGLSLLTYGLVVYAYTIAQVGAVTALRETSVIFGALGGMFFLGEPKSRARIIGALVIASGAAMIAVNLK